MLARIVPPPVPDFAHHLDRFHTHFGGQRFTVRENVVMTGQQVQGFLPA